MVRAFIAALGLAACLALPAYAEEKAPSWNELNPTEKSLLAPVSGEWNNLPARQRRMLLDLTERYPKCRRPNSSARRRELPSGQR